MDTYLISGGHGRRVVIFKANLYPVPLLRTTGTILPLPYTPHVMDRETTLL